MTTLIVDSWQHPGRLDADGSPDLNDPNWKTSTTTSPAVTGCGLLAFSPSLQFFPDTKQADAPAGYTADISVPQSNDVADQQATPELESVFVTLPPGVAVSPSAANGLAGCSDDPSSAAGDQVMLSSTRPARCPAASQIGVADVTTPLLADHLHGQVFLGAPRCGAPTPCGQADASNGNLLRLFLELEGQGIVAKVPGIVTADPTTGRLTAIFERNPQLPFSELLLRFKGGQRAALVNPPACRATTTNSQLAPWSARAANGTAPATSSFSFNVDWDNAGGPCPATLPFSPSFLGQTTLPLAREFTPFTVSFAGGDRQQRLSQISLRTPPGLLGMLSSVTLCGEPQASQGTCSSASSIGSATVSAGAGTEPFQLSGQVYLTGPYRGAPFGLSVVVPAVAGPFNLGMVVVRATIIVDPHDSHLTITSDPLPQILSGVPTHVQRVDIVVDRPDFMFNPTNCSPQSVSATIYSSQGTGAEVSTPFAVTGCTGVVFKPKFSASSSARTSRANGASLDVKIDYTPNEANVKSVKVALPKQLPSRLTTIQKACRDTVFDVNPAACGVGSLVGTATALTPVLPVRLNGPVYLVSHGGAAFPDIVAVLQGEGVTIELTGSIFISSKGITSSTFGTVPDVPVSSFELKLPAGPYSALTANGSLCSKALTMPTTIIGQNGARLTQTTKIKVTSCPKTKKKPRKKPKTKGKARQAIHPHGGAR
ncbi:MAG TPA: hypothetical protein VLJ42_08220 [Solirubrobacteraceae bacterium]|nr:hypothetical protein [Solirubrobacteraceae bacterium]